MVKHGILIHIFPETDVYSVLFLFSYIWNFHRTGRRGKFAFSFCGFIWKRKKIGFQMFNFFYNVIVFYLQPQKNL